MRKVELTHTDFATRVDRALTTKVFRSIQAIPAEDWNCVYPEALEGYGYFKALDESNLEQFSLRYILVSDGDIPVGAATCFIMEYSIDTTLRGVWKTLFVNLKKIFPHFMSLKAVMCGQPIGQGRIGFAGDAEKILKAIRECIEKIAEEESALLVVFKEFDREYGPLFGGLEKEGYRRFESLPNTVKQLSYKNFDDYLMSLSYKTRYDLKRKFKKADAGESLRLEVCDRLNGALDEAYGLYRQMVSRHEMGLEVMPKEFFSKVSDNMPAETKFFLWRMDGRLVAFAFCLVSGDYFLDFYLGLNYDVAHEYHLYFVRFRDMMTWCLENGIRTYEMGCTNYDPKKRLDFTFVPLDIYVKFRSSFINLFSKVIVEFIKPQKHDPFLKQMIKKEKRGPTRLTWPLIGLILMNETIDLTAQVLMKKGMTVSGSSLLDISKISQLLIHAAGSTFVQLGTAIYILNFFVWILVLSRLDLSVAVPLTSLNYLILPMLALFILHEHVTLWVWAGSVIILFGIYFLSKTDGLRSPVV